jgi:hypothetical protein
MNCERCSELLIEYIHGGLSPEEREAVAAHLVGCEECMREFEEYAEIRRVVSEESPLPEPSPEVMARLSRAARAEVARGRRPFWKRLPLSPILIPALTTAVALMVWFYYGQGGGDYMDTVSRDVMARKMKEQDSSMRTVGQAAPEKRREYPVEAESSPAMSERGAAEEGMPAAPAPPQAELYYLSDEAPGASAGTEEDSDVKEEALSETASKKSAPGRPLPQSESLSAGTANDYSGQLLLALRQQTEGDCDASIKTNETLLQSTPEPPGYVRARSYRSLAECYEKQGKLDLAVSNYTKLRQISPEESSFADTQILEIRQKAVHKLGSASPTPGPVN